jgi:hypothetical protein
MVKINMRVTDTLRWTVRDRITGTIKEQGENRSSNTLTTYCKVNLVRLLGNIGTGRDINAVDAYRGSWSRDSSPTVDTPTNNVCRCTSSAFTTAGTYTEVRATNTAESTGGSNYHTTHTINITISSGDELSFQIDITFTGLIGDGNTICASRLANDGSGFDDYIQYIRAQHSTWSVVAAVNEESAYNVLKVYNTTSFPVDNSNNYTVAEISPTSGAGTIFGQWTLFEFGIYTGYEFYIEAEFTFTG